MTPQAVIFDLDDTLFDHTGAATRGVSGLIAELGHAPAPELIDVWFDAELRGSTAWHSGELSFDAQRRQRIGELLTALDHDSARDDATLSGLFGRYIAHYEGSWQGFDDVAATLTQLDDRALPWAVLTNGAQHLQVRKVAHLGLTDAFEHLACCDAIGCAKPDPRAYLHVCELLGSDPAHTLHVGDNHALDVIGAREAGLPAVHLDRRRIGPHDEAQQISTLNDLGDHLR